MTATLNPLPSEIFRWSGNTILNLREGGSSEGEVPAGSSAKLPAVREDETDKWADLEIDSRIVGPRFDVSSFIFYSGSLFSMARNMIFLALFLF